MIRIYIFALFYGSSEVGMHGPPYLRSDLTNKPLAIQNGFAWIFSDRSMHIYIYIYTLLWCNFIIKSNSHWSFNNKTNGISQNRKKDLGVIYHIFNGDFQNYIDQF
jgi:hypothetical protein